MSLQVSLSDDKVFFCPLASLHSLSAFATSDTQMLADCFLFDDEVRPGWIKYKPQNITVITSNQMFQPLGNSPSDIVHSKKQLVVVKTANDIATLGTILEKPVLMCVTRRHHCGTPVDISPGDTQTDAANKDTVSGFDIDFAVIFPPGVLKQKLKETLEFVQKSVAKKQKFCVKIDLKQVFKDLTPPEMQLKDSLEYVSWHNTTFWLTNHSKPHHSLTYINNLFFWTALFPYAVFAALPYRIGRRMRCKDRHVSLNNEMNFTVGSVEDKVVVCTWKAEAPTPGEYRKQEGSFSLCAAELSWLKPFVRNCRAITFNFDQFDSGSLNE